MGKIRSVIMKDNEEDEIFLITDVPEDVTDEMVLNENSSKSERSHMEIVEYDSNIYTKNDISVTFKYIRLEKN
ncbi:MAG: hypothetical protein KA277_02225 [Fusobacteriaceae bacterium]|mgnify:FL=1|nr:hypothetical protein [Fusobacteriaceae bacterium]MBP6466823.1 hypothetical protein [Fusobacteriaceae bacterium]MBP9595151.1 hypothetical protein [Fusobacteriaceae bacterium]MBU9917999.1 hypothetical protein [Fusobacteriaceae bacterium]